MSVGDARERSIAIVTVGSFKFDELIKAVDSEAFLDVLRTHHIHELKVQRAGGSYLPHVITDESKLGNDFRVSVVQYEDDLPLQLRTASLVISHAGAGTCLDCLIAGRRLVVVPNENLMANHQIELGMALHNAGVLFCFRHYELVEQLRDIQFESLRCFPDRTGPVFAQHVHRIVGLPPPS